MSLLKELQDINKWLDQLIWEVNKFNETIEDLSARYNQSLTDSKKS
jgi:peptidoglycan hydrolase CwlO-like protein